MSGKSIKESTKNLSCQRGSYEYLQKFSFIGKEKYEGFRKNN
jgi:hypothetical protein